MKNQDLIIKLIVKDILTSFPVDDYNNCTDDELWDKLEEYGLDYYNELITKLEDKRNGKS